MLLKINHWVPHFFFQIGVFENTIEGAFGLNQIPYQKIDFNLRDIGSMQTRLETSNALEIIYCKGYSNSVYILDLSCCLKPTLNQKTWAVFVSVYHDASLRIFLKFCASIRINGSVKRARGISGVNRPSLKNPLPP